MEDGTISLALRNPTDNTSTTERPSTYIAELTGGSLSAPARGPWSGGIFGGKLDLTAANEAGTVPGGMVAALLSALKSKNEKAEAAAAVTPAIEPPAPKERRQWEMEILRGSVLEKILLPLEP